MDPHEIHQHALLMAIRSTLVPDDLTLYRKFCRSFSKKFNTPLPDVEKLDPYYVIQTYYEDMLEGIDLDDDQKVSTLLDRLLTIEDPSYQANAEEDLKDWMEEAMEEEEVRLQKKESLAKALKPKKSEAPQVKEKKPTELPKKGGINLAYLAESENEG